MSKTNEIVEAIDMVTEKGTVVLSKTKDYMAAIEILMVALASLRALLLKNDGGEAND